MIGRGSKGKKRRGAQARGRRRAEDDVLAVLTEEESGREYYISLIDVFDFEGREYSVMYNYKPSAGRRLDPEVVIMRSYRDRDGSRVFSSIRGNRELELVFELFYERFLEAGRQGGAHAI